MSPSIPSPSRTVLGPQNGRERKVLLRQPHWAKVCPMSSSKGWSPHQLLAGSKSPARPSVVLVKKRAVSIPAGRSLPWRRLFTRRSGYPRFRAARTRLARNESGVTARQAIASGSSMYESKKRLPASMLRLKGSNGSVTSGNSSSSCWKYSVPGPSYCDQSRVWVGCAQPSRKERASTEKSTALSAAVNGWPGASWRDETSQRSTALMDGVNCSFHMPDSDRLQKFK